LRVRWLLWRGKTCRAVTGSSFHLSGRHRGGCDIPDYPGHDQERELLSRCLWCGRWQGLLPGQQVSSNFGGNNLASGWITTPVGPVPVVATRLNWRDILGTIFVRCAMGRMQYAVEPGLYAVGAPCADSPVMVSANYKLSFDHLRSSLAGIDAWILVLATRGINVWCAAGKGTFGTGELVKRVETTRISSVVSRRQLILPQLGAPGVSAHEVTRQTRFKVVYGPVRAADIRAFLGTGMKATLEMRRVRFNLADRAVLIPVEMVIGFTPIIAVAAAMVLLGGLSLHGYSLDRATDWAPLEAALAMGAFLVPVILVPLLLPWLPGRAFAVKGAWLGVLLAAILYATAFNGQIHLAGHLELYGWMVGIIVLSSFLGMNFTGASTYTSLSGVYKEMKMAVPLQKALTVVAGILWLAGRLTNI